MYHCIFPASLADVIHRLFFCEARSLSNYTHIIIICFLFYILVLLLIVSFIASILFLLDVLADNNTGSVNLSKILVVRAPVLFRLLTSLWLMTSLALVNCTQLLTKYTMAMFTTDASSISVVKGLVKFGFNILVNTFPVFIFSFNLNWKRAFKGSLYSLCT